ncbi:fibronectin type III domain-containing protein [Flavobacterium azooxidireducens]|uniref:Fibronectin type III domain-containing protein n=1 Tax=Flavobacterium azooxidireducens TaxID=1871076 RepID=A0ABY4KCV3_9FLAO|nr:fibronectin type III domain-containing protein [Flavobacterium azooxidireducens]UPQ78620.1 fibronectin type III domain-containing protein [Flavobacterium azooxidireducens]
MKKFIALVLFVSLLSGCEIENINYKVPLVISYEPENVLTNSAILGGIVLAEGGKDVTEYGVVVSTSENPTINDTKVVIGNRLGEFFIAYSNLQPATTYFYRAYGVNEVGAGYGESYQFTTGVATPCNPTQPNRVDYGFGQLNVNNVSLNEDAYYSESGNLEFEATSSFSAARIFVSFNEINANYPLTGEYTITNESNFNSFNNLSKGKARLNIMNFGMGGPAAATAQPGTKIYVENDGFVMTIIFCNTSMGNYSLNGKFSKVIN